MPETDAARPRLQRAGRGRTASAAPRDHTPGAPGPQTRGRAGWAGTKPGPRAPAAAAPVSLTTAPGHSPSPGTGEGREQGPSARGWRRLRRPGAPPGLGSRGPGSRTPPGRGLCLPCSPSPGHSPRSERTGCRPPWPRQPALRGRAGGGLTAAAAAPPPAGPPRLLPQRPRDPGRPRTPPPATLRVGWGRACGARERRAPGWGARVPGLKGRGDQLVLEEAGPETCESAEKGCARLRVSAPGPGPRPGAWWACSAQDTALNRRPARDGQKGSERLDFVLVG